MQKALRKAGTFFGARQFASDAIDSRRLARFEARKARESLPLLYRAKKRVSRSAKLKARKVVRAARSPESVRCAKKAVIAMQQPRKL